jgi:hypothetical protein
LTGFNVGIGVVNAPAAQDSVSEPDANTQFASTVSVQLPPLGNVVFVAQLPAAAPVGGGGIQHGFGVIVGPGVSAPDVQLTTSDPPTSVYPASGTYLQLAPSARVPVQLPAAVPTGVGGNVHGVAALTTGAAFSTPFVHVRVNEPDTSV